MRRAFIVVLSIVVFFSLAFSLLAARGRTLSPSFLAGDQTAPPLLAQARTELQKGFHLWDPEIMKSARDRFLALLLGQTPPAPGLVYEIAVADYRLGNYYLAAGNKDEAERYVSEALKYTAQAREENPKQGEADALEAYLVGMVLALHPDQAMALVSQSVAAFSAAFSKSPENPRVYLLKGQSVYYTPEAYGGGPRNALDFLEKSLSLADSSWGREEAGAYLGLCYKSLGNKDKAREFLKKSLEACPDYSFAAHELKILGDK